MNKKVNIITSAPVVGLKTFRYPIVGRLTNVELTVEDILHCILSKAKVEEILENGSTVKLDLVNYNKDNSIKDEEEPDKDKIKEDNDVTTDPAHKDENKDSNQKDTNTKTEVINDIIGSINITKNNKSK